MAKNLLRVLGLLLVSCAVGYATEPDPMRFQDQMQKEVATWSGNLKGPVTRLFWLLVTLDFAWTTIQLAIKASGLEDFAATIVKKLFFYGFGVLLLTNGAVYAQAIIDSLIKLAGIAASRPSSNPLADIWDFAFDAIADLYQSMEKYNWLSQAGLILLNGIVIIAMGALCAYISVILVLAYCEAFIVISLSVVLLAFNASNYTSEYGRKFFHFSLLSGLKLFATIILAYLGITIMKEWAWTFRSSSVSNILAGTVCFGVYAALVQKIPEVFVNAVSGGGLSGTSDSVASSAVKMAAVGTAAAVTGGAAATGAAASLAKAEGSKGVLGVAGGTAKNLAKAFGEDMKGNFAAKSFDLKSQPSMGHRMALRMGDARGGLMRGSAGGAEGNSISAGDSKSPSTGTVSPSDQRTSDLFGSGNNGGPGLGNDQGAMAGDGPGSAGGHPVKESRFDPTGDNLAASIGDSSKPGAVTKGDNAPSSPQVRNSAGGMGVPSSSPGDFVPPIGSTVEADWRNAMSRDNDGSTGIDPGESQGDSAGQIANASGSAAPGAPRIRNSTGGMGVPSSGSSDFVPPSGSTVRADSRNAMSPTAFDPTGDNMGTSQGDSAGQIANAAGSAAPAAPQIRNSGGGTGAPVIPSSPFTPPTGTTVQADPRNSMSGNQVPVSRFDPTGDNMSKADRLEKIRKQMENFRAKAV